jgi:hypothetical protein
MEVYNDKKIIHSLMGKNIWSTFKYICCYIFIWYSLLSYFFRYLNFKIHIQLSMYILCAIIILLRGIVVNVKYYHKDKKSKLKKLIMQFNIVAKNENCDEIRYQLVKDLCYKDKVAIKAEIKSSLGFEFLIPFILTCVISLFNVAVSTKDLVTYTPAQQNAIDQKLISMMLSEEITDLQVINNKNKELIELYKEKSVKNYLSALVTIVSFGIVVILYLAAGFIQSIRVNKCILTYLEEVK